MSYGSDGSTILIHLFGTYRYEHISLILTWLLGGFLTALALRLTNNRTRGHHILIMTLCWLLAGCIWVMIQLQAGPWVSYKSLYMPGWYTLHLAGLIGGVAIAIVVAQIQPSLRVWQLAVIVAGWTLGRILAGEESINRSLYQLPLFNYPTKPALFGTIFGAIGGITMCAALYVSNWGVDDLPSFPQLNILWQSSGELASLLQRAQKSCPNKYRNWLWIGLSIILIGITGMSIKLPQVRLTLWGSRIGISLLLGLIITFSAMLAFVVSAATINRLNDSQMMILRLTGVHSENIVVALMQYFLYQFRFALILQVALLTIAVPISILSSYRLISYVPNYLQTLGIISECVGIVVGAFGLNILAVTLSVHLTTQWNKVEFTPLFIAIIMLVISVLLAGIIFIYPHFVFPVLQQIAAAILFAIFPYLLSTVMLRWGILRARQADDISSN